MLELACVYVVEDLFESFLIKLSYPTCYEISVIANKRYIKVTNRLTTYDFYEWKMDYQINKKRTKLGI